jgi:C4-dicarboxylate-specific signal transduction histidine kinase
MSPTIPPRTTSHERSFQQRLRECVLAFSRQAGSPSTFPEALAPMAAEAAALMGAARASIWIHDRRARELWLVASSDAPEPAHGPRLAAGEAGPPAALGLTLDRPTRLGDDPTSSIVAPLRGWRRALGTLVLEGCASPELSAEQVLELANDVARQLSAVIENLQLVEEVVRQHRLLKDCFNSLADLVIVTDNGLRVVQTNDALARCLKRRADEMIETGLETLVGQELAAWVIDAASANDEGSATSSRPPQARTRTFEGSPLGRTVVVTVTPLVSDAHDLLGRVIVARDVSPQVELEAEREALRARLVQSEKLAALGQFVAGVAHEINNPLQGVLGYAELLLRSDKALPVRAELRRVLHEADRAAKIVRNLLVFSGSRRMVRRRLTVERMISRAISSRRGSLVRSGIEIVRRHPDEPRSVVGDPLLLQQAFLNVVINAEHALVDAGRRGTIDITTEESTDGRTIVTRIHDTGPGIDRDALPRIFDPFFTTKEVNRGTGLGLTIAYGIVQEHGGSIHAANAPDGGAQFTIELPAAAERPPGRRRRRTAEDA